MRSRPELIAIAPMQAIRPCGSPVRWTGACPLGAWVREAVERDHILTVLQRTSWVITGPRGAATVLGLNPSTLRSRIKKLGISRSPG
jgi:transcriptional regulator with GAF, ATPase, and Fis domain